MDNGYPPASRRQAGMGARLLSTLHTGWVLMLRSAQARLTYTGAYAWDLLVSLFAFSAVFLIWNHVSGIRGAAGGMQRSTLLTYLVVVYCLNFALTISLDGVVGRRVRQGLIANDLLKPVGFQAMLFAGVLGEMWLQAVLAAAMVTLALVFLPLNTLAGWADHPLACLLSLALAVMVQFGICFAMSLAAFVTQFSYGSFYLRISLHFTFSGLMAPLALFPAAMRSAAAALPFAQVLHAPASLLLGWERNGPWPILAGQAAWAAGLWLLGSLLFSLGVRRLVIQGG